ncbi:MAG: ATP-binding cassette domain-containing protein [Lachnospiraceae bacterium]|nr:ATP-binding cassette domain-containing protein [Lachnospiraceae bacterium]
MLLEVQNLQKYFQTPAGALHAVDGVSFTIEKGETMGVVGESGCGKSTLGRVILHLLDSTGGKIFFEDQDITQVSRKELKQLQRKMQIIFQDPFSSLNPRMTVSEIIQEPLIITKTPKDQIEKKVKEMMDTVGLASRLVNSYPHELDGGRRQRIGVARALVLDPSFIVCDEPVSALDVSIQAQIINLLLDLQKERGLTYLFITHDLSVVKYVSHNICVMYLGQLVEKSPATELFRHPTHPYTQALLSAIPVPDVDYQKKRILLKGELSSPINPKPGCRFAARCQYASPECSQKEPELREISPGHLVACHKTDSVQ